MSSDRSLRPLCTAASGPDADRRSEKLVGFLQARREIDGIAMGRVVELAAGADLSDDGDAGLDADARAAEFVFGEARPPAHFLGQRPDRLGAVDRLVDVIIEILRRIEEGVHGIADDLVDHPAIARRPGR